MQQNELAPGQSVKKAAQPVSAQAQPLQVAQSCKAVWKNVQIALLHDQLSQRSEVCQACCGSGADVIVGHVQALEARD